MIKLVQAMISDITAPTLTETELTELRSYLDTFNTKELKAKFAVSGRSKADIIDAILSNGGAVNRAVAMHVVYKDQSYAESALMRMKVKDLQTRFDVKGRTKAELVRRILSDNDNRPKLDKLMMEQSQISPAKAPCTKVRSNSSPGAMLDSGVIPIEDSLKSAVVAIKTFHSTPKPDRRGVPTALREKVWRKHNTFKVGGEYRCSMDGKCFCCQSAVTYNDHQSGHIISDRHGGKIAMDNLRPVCSSCNKNMGAANMYEYMFRQGWTKTLESTVIVHLEFYHRLELAVLHKSSLTSRDGKTDEKLLSYLNYKRTPLNLRMKLVTALLLG